MKLTEQEFNARLIKQHGFIEMSKEDNKHGIGKDWINIPVHKDVSLAMDYLKEAYLTNGDETSKAIALCMLNNAHKKLTGKYHFDIDPEKNTDFQHMLKGK